MDPLVLSVLYVWCQINKDMIVTFWFGMQFKASVLTVTLEVNYGIQILASIGYLQQMNHRYFDHDFCRQCTYHGFWQFLIWLSVEGKSSCIFILNKYISFSHAFVL